ncbi:unnamed protein product [Prunus armeniaca]|uniref:Uncharacterized protein n=1 Tax=Prunus armeniaca TaxID=36596 RepID=A0A6J5TS58_PRUAR|nr:unnamed protein product [Prunus armeniaca]
MIIMSIVTLSSLPAMPYIICMPICKFAYAIHPIPLTYFTWPGAAAFSISIAFASKCPMPCTASAVRGP